MHLKHRLLQVVGAGAIWAALCGQTALPAQAPVQYQGSAPSTNSGSSGTVTSVATGCDLTGGTITTSGTISAAVRDAQSSDANYAIPSTDGYVVFTGAFSTTRTATLPAASSVGAGCTITIKDDGAINGSNTLIVATHSSGDHIDIGVSDVLSLSLVQPGIAVALKSDGVSGWEWTSLTGVQTVSVGAGLQASTAVGYALTISGLNEVNKQTTTYTLLGTDADKLVVFTGSSATTFSTPAPASATTTQFYYVSNSSSNGSTLTLSTVLNGGTFEEPGGSTSNTLSIAAGGFVLFSSDGTNFWYVVSSAVSWPTSGDVVISGGVGSNPTGVAPSGTACLVSSSGSWVAGSCSGSGGTQEYTDGTNTVSAATQLTFGSGTVGGSNPDATYTPPPAPIMGASSAVQAQSLTRYYAISGNASANTSESGVSGLDLAPRAGTLKNFYCQSSAAPGNGNSITITLRVAAGSPASGPVCTISGTNTTANDTTDSATVTAGELLDYQVVTTTLAGSVSIYWGITYQ